MELSSISYMQVKHIITLLKDLSSKCNFYLYDHTFKIRIAKSCECVIASAKNRNKQKSRFIDRWQSERNLLHENESWSLWRVHSYFSTKAILLIVANVLSILSSFSFHFRFYRDILSGNDTHATLSLTVCVVSQD